MKLDLGAHMDDDNPHKKQDMLLMMSSIWTQLNLINARLDSIDARLESLCSWNEYTTPVQRDDTQ
tara:strand:+ start:1609 stop:1803 length:195 start_codon:yes stop_codon:yes gene_type:complete